MTGGGLQPFYSQQGTGGERQRGAEGQKAGFFTAIRMPKHTRDTRCGPYEEKGNRAGIQQTHQIVYQVDSACSKFTVGRPFICLYLPHCHFPARGFTGIASISHSPSTSDYHLNPSRASIGVPIGQAAKAGRAWKGLVLSRSCTSH